MDKTPDLVFSPDELQRLRQPLVYVVRSPVGIVRYVGMSSNGIGRPFAKTHHAVGLSRGETLELHFCDTVAGAAALERRLIVALQPELNRVSRGPMPTAFTTKKRSGEVGIFQFGKSWRAFIRRDDVLASKVCATQAEARKWRREWLQQYVDARALERVQWRDSLPPHASAVL